MESDRRNLINLIVSGNSGLAKSVSDVASLGVTGGMAATKSRRGLDKRWFALGPTQQLPAPIHLQVLSRNETTKIGRSSTPFEYDMIAGEGATVFLMDSDVNLDDPDLADAVFDDTWIFTRSTKMTKNDWLVDRRHGTKMAIAMVGRHNGPAKRARIIVVKTTREAGDILDAMQKIGNRIVSEGLQGKAIILIAKGFELNWVWYLPHGPKPLFERCIQKFLDLGVTPVIAAGNMQETDPDYAEGAHGPLAVTAWPAIMGANSTDLTVVTMIDGDGKVDVQCRDAPFINFDVGMDTIKSASGETYGTSPASAITAATYAYFLSIELKKSPQRPPAMIPGWLKQQAIAYAKPLKPGQKPMLSNRIPLK